MITRDTIAAVATPPGIGGVAIIRISGSAAAKIAGTLLGDLPKPRYAAYRRFHDRCGELLDEGICLYFPAPHSFTGEDVIELQGHGGPVVVDLLLQRIIECGARLARPGEFSERAFLNGKLDLVQAEAIADLIECTTATAARMAVRSLDGLFSHRIDQLVDQLVQLRIYVEAAIDFPEEEIDFLNDGKVSRDLRTIIETLQAVQGEAQRGRLLREGMTLVIAGRPNAGKSSLLNALSGGERAIVTEIAGTTRDLLREQIEIDGLPLHLIDTAGLRESDDLIEQEGVRRAHQQIRQADRILWIYDGREAPDIDPQLPDDVPLTLIRNKIDLTGEDPGCRDQQADAAAQVSLCARDGQGIDLLRSHLKQAVGFHSGGEGGFIARRRHLDAIDRAADHLQRGQRQLLQSGSGELLAEELRLAQNVLSEITGAFTSDDLLGEIFSSFCIGK